MRKPTSNFVPLERLLPRLAFCSFAMFVAVCCPCATAGLGLLTWCECETPVDLDASCKEAAISHPVRTRVGRNRPGLRLVAPLSAVPSHETSVTVAPRSGHRLANNLMAPLRC